jgi:hypothetical protein
MIRNAALETLLSYFRQRSLNLRCVRATLAFALSGASRWSRYGRKGRHRARICGGGLAPFAIGVRLLPPLHVSPVPESLRHFVYRRRDLLEGRTRWTAWQIEDQAGLDQSAHLHAVTRPRGVIHGESLALLKVQGDMSE